MAGGIERELLLGDKVDTERGHCGWELSHRRRRHQEPDHGPRRRRERVVPESPAPRFWVAIDSKYV